MMIDEFRQLLAYLGSFSAGALIAALVVFLLLRSFLPSYLGRKGENLATREDVGKITEEVKKVESRYAAELQDLVHQNSMLVEQLRGEHQLRLAAAERRLVAHQEAFTLWRRLIASAHGDEVHRVVIECQDWWDRNCLFLTAEARDAFNESYHSAAGIGQ